MVMAWVIRRGMRRSGNVATAGDSVQLEVQAAPKLLAYRHPAHRASVLHVEHQIVSIRAKEISGGHSRDRMPTVRRAVEYRDIVALPIKSPALSKCKQVPASIELPPSGLFAIEFSFDPHCP